MRLAVAVALLAAASAVQASPIGTPQSNRPPSGRPKPLDLPFGHHRAARASVATAAAERAPAVPAARRMTQGEWRKAYIARHGHDLPTLSHPGR